MAVDLAEQRLGDVRWIVLRGPAGFPRPAAAGLVCRRMT
jgi:hypothetical protein